MLESITKEGISAFKAQSDAMETAARAGYLKSHAAQLDFQRSKEYLDHAIKMAEAPQRAHGDELRKLDELRRRTEKEDADQLIGTPTPAIIKRFFGINDMGELARYYGRNNLEKLMQTALQAEASMNNAAQIAGARVDARTQNEAMKWIALAERYNNDILKITEMPSLDQWNKLSKAEQQAMAFAGVKPRNPDQEAHLQQLNIQRDAAYRKAYGPAYDEMMRIKGAQPEVRVLKPTSSGAPAPRSIGPAVANPPSSTIMMYLKGLQDVAGFGNQGGGA